MEYNYTFRNEPTALPMNTSWHWNAFHIIGPLYVESTDHKTNTQAASDLRHYGAHECNVTVIMVITPVARNWSIEL